MFMQDAINQNNQSTIPKALFPKDLLDFCQKFGVYPIKLTEHFFEIAVADSTDPQTLAKLKFSTSYPLKIVHWPENKLMQSLSERFNSPINAQTNQPQNADLQSLTANQNIQQANTIVANHSDDENGLLVWIDKIISLAVSRKASDIHFEPYPEKGRVRLRVDGVLDVIKEYSAKDALRLATRLKILGELDIAERRLPQDGQLKTTINNQTYTMRISTLPTQYGEKIVLRILQSETKLLQLDELGMDPTQQQIYEKALSSPQGLILVTGPTGSGKTVSLYAGLSRLNNPEKNICSVEDPVELPLYGINQTQTNPKTDLNFANVLRAFLRQDPDVLMIGEIRDAETAEIAIKAAQTGHLVLSTLHTNSTAETIVRLKQMDIPGYLIASSLKLIIAQRLVRKLCENCKEESSELLILPDTVLKNLDAKEPVHFHPVGCDHCFNGYQGRVGIYEFLVPNNEIKQAITDQVSAEDIIKLQIEHKQPHLIEQAFNLVFAGVTSIDEIYRVIGEY